VLREKEGEKESLGESDRVRERERHRERDRQPRVSLFERLKSVKIPQVSKVPSSLSDLYIQMLQDLVCLRE
jgi:hypothetical protein